MGNDITAYCPFVDLVDLNRKNKKIIAPARIAIIIISATLKFNKEPSKIVVPLPNKHIAIQVLITGYEKYA